MKKKLFGLCVTTLLLSMAVLSCSEKGASHTSSSIPDITTPHLSAPSDTTAGQPDAVLPEVKYIDVIKDGNSQCAIIFDSDLCKVAAYSFFDIARIKTGVSLDIRFDVSDPPVHIISFGKGDEETLGNYGYSISADEFDIVINASSISGFDMAIRHLFVNFYNSGALSVPQNYSVTEKLNWDSDYILDGDDHNPAYISDTFYNDKNDAVAYVSNAMWHMFGLVDDGQNLVYKFGNEPTWYEWMSEKLMWNGNEEYVGTLKNKIRTFPQVSTGYMWSWGSYPYWKVDTCYSIHYDGTFRYISSVYDIISWEGKTDFLYEKDDNKAGGAYSHLDASSGRTVLEKTEACMSYIMNYLYGSEGYIRLTEESTYLNEDGSERFDYVIDTGEYCWNNTGLDGSHASNYWDNLCFGNYDGYSNALFYNSLLSMSGIYRMLGGEYIQKAEELEALSVKVKEKFNDLYWSDETGRYIACIDTDGRIVDFGLTFHNFEIMKYGLSDEAKAKSIFDWVDGDRNIKGETRRGNDIFSYGKLMQSVDSKESIAIKKLKLRLAAVSNTVSIDNKENSELGIAWWHGPAGINVWGSAAYGKHLENGGYIFYPVFYELMARTLYEGAQSTTDRLYDIARVYEYNRLKSDAAAIGSTHWLEGLNGEYPENGLVPTVYIYSLIGASAEYDGLHIAPSFNDVYEYMGVKTLKYKDICYDIKVNRDASLMLTPENGKADLTLHYTPERFSSADYTLTVFYSDGNSKTQTLTPDSNGVITVEISEENAKSISLSPVLD